MPCQSTSTKAGHRAHHLEKQDSPTTQELTGHLGHQQLSEHAMKAKGIEGFHPVNSNTAGQGTPCKTHQRALEEPKAELEAKQPDTLPCSPHRLAPFVSLESTQFTLSHFKPQT